MSYVDQPFTPTNKLSSLAAICYMRGVRCHCCCLAFRVMECQKEVRSHLRDDFDTPRALDSLTGLVHATNVSSPLS